jgi:hypothetical protein
MFMTTIEEDCKEELDKLGLSQEAIDRFMRLMNGTSTQEKFSHLDTCLSDPGWCEGGEGSAIYGIAGKLWRATKKAIGEHHG